MRNLIRRVLSIASIKLCSNGHVYDGDSYQSCPYC